MLDRYHHHSLVSILFEKEGGGTGRIFIKKLFFLAIYPTRALRELTSFDIFTNCQKVNFY